MEIIGAKPKQQKKKPYIFIGSIAVAVLVVVGITVGTESTGYDRYRITASPAFQQQHQQDHRYQQILSYHLQRSSL